MRMRSWVVLLVAGLSVAGSGMVCIPPQDHVQDVSGFAVFHFEQLGALGYCPDKDVPYKATITRQADGSYLLEMSVFEADTSESEECSEDLYDIDGYCLAVSELPARVLTDEESQQVRGRVFRGGGDV